MAKRSITQAEAKRLMREIVEEKGPDYVHKGMCVYFHKNGKPACIIGHLIYKLGLRKKDVAASGSFCDYNEGQSAEELCGRFFPKTSARVIVALRVAQSLQDDQYSWGVALEAFERVLSGESWKSVQTAYRNEAA